ncbi:hypothetical protein MARCHEWKA_04960 [Brevundimonas phage vB_BpoS-Marchewka]|uniref:Uncharacterized protein n=1 Tax=Brevundimonas phage vB_BpoS-Marchewka TaxID=2948604 RepID=A0A9E7N573_9CAUD|nr:hypothetical protein MARCHEWKA_04960 [Brevundimonas phage vB_BpoS-Marchewka]
MSLVRFTLTSPQDPALHARVTNARCGFNELVREARQRKIDPGDAVYAEQTLRMAESRHSGTWGIAEYADRMLKAARTQHRAYLLALLDEMDAWDAAQEAKKAAQP